MFEIFSNLSDCLAYLFYALLFVTYIFVNNNSDFNFVYKFCDYLPKVQVQKKEGLD